MLRLTVRLGSDEWVFGFPQDEVVIGAARASGLVLEHASVSPQHAKIERFAGNIYVQGLDPENPLLVNDRQTSRTLVREGDCIDVGPYRLGLLDRDPPEKAERDFLRAIEEAPNDDAPRAVYSDWLEEQGRHDDAQFLRAQIEVRGLSADHPRFRQLSEVIETLAPRFSLTWRRAVARPVIENCGFELECPKRWDELKKTAKPDERWCGACRKNVYFAKDIARARELAMAGRCVALDLVVLRTPRDLAPPVPVMLGRMVSPRDR